MPRFFRTAVLGMVLLGGASALAMPAPCRANQFVLIDVTFTLTQEEGMKTGSHYFVRGDKINPDRPKDWTSPVDYRNGTVHIRTEVLEKPEGGEITTWSLCYLPNKGQKNNYGCTNTGTYREKGVYEREESMTKFWENDSIVWSEGVKEVACVLKGDKNLHAHKRPDPEKFFPTKVRITMVQVAAGSKYDPSLVPNLPPAKKG